MDCMALPAIEVDAMKLDITIEDYIFSRKLPRWATLKDAEKLRLLETARCRTYRTGGTGRQVATTGKVGKPNRR